MELNMISALIREDLDSSGESGHLLGEVIEYYIVLIYLVMVNPLPLGVFSIHHRTSSRDIVMVKYYTGRPSLLGCFRRASLSHQLGKTAMGSIFNLARGPHFDIQGILPQWSARLSMTSQQNT